MIFSPVMPIRLPPLTRRLFLRRSLFAGAALVMGERLLPAADTPSDPNTWAFLSDPHISADPLKKERGVVMTENLKAVVDEIMSLSKRPARMFIDGDCAHHTGEIADYTQFLSLIEPVRKAGIPIDLTLGNHDHRDRFITSIPGAKEHPHPVENRYVSVLQTERANWFLLDSLDHVNETPGLLGQAQLDWLAKQLDANKDRPAIICGHHTLDKNIGLQDADAFLAELAARKQVKAYIFGHSHQWSFAEHEGIHLINLPAVGYVFQKGQPSGWVSASLKESGLRLELSALDKTHPAHGEVKELTWRS